MTQINSEMIIGGGGGGGGSYTGSGGIALVGNDFRLANMPASTFKGNATGASAAPTDLTATQATALLNTFTSTLKGLVPASGGGTTAYLRADGVFQVIDKTTVGLGNVDNTSDVNKPVSTAQAAADALRVLKAGDTMTGPLGVPSLSFTPGTDLTLATDAITVTNGFHRIRTEGAAATDTLATISGTAVGGQILILVPGSNTETFTIVSTGNIRYTGPQITLSGLRSYIVLIYDATTSNWSVAVRPMRDLGELEDTTDTDVSYTYNNSGFRNYISGITAARTRILLASAFAKGDVRRFYNLSAQTVTVRNLTAGGTILVTLAPNKWAMTRFDGTNHVLVESGSMTTAP